MVRGGAEKSLAFLSPILPAWCQWASKSEIWVQTPDLLCVPSSATHCSACSSHRNLGQVIPSCLSLCFPIHVGRITLFASLSCELSSRLNKRGGLGLNHSSVLHHFITHHAGPLLPSLNLSLIIHKMFPPHRPVETVKMMLLTYMRCPAIVLIALSFYAQSLLILPRKDIWI